MEQALERMRTEDQGEAWIETALSYTSGQPVVVRVRRRGHRYDIDDDGSAVRLAGEPEGWFDDAAGLATAQGMNINRSGVVFVPAVEGRDIAALVLSVADTSLSLYFALLESDLAVEFDSDTSVE